jgi:hypothetical protein
MSGPATVEDVDGLELLMQALSTTDMTIRPDEKDYYNAISAAEAAAKDEPTPNEDFFQDALIGGGQGAFAGDFYDPMAGAYMQGIYQSPAESPMMPLPQEDMTAVTPGSATHDEDAHPAPVKAEGKKKQQQPPQQQQPQQPLQKAVAERKGSKKMGAFARALGEALKRRNRDAVVVGLVGGVGVVKGNDRLEDRMVEEGLRINPARDRAVRAGPTPKVHKDANANARGTLNKQLKLYGAVRDPSSDLEDRNFYRFAFETSQSWFETDQGIEEVTGAMLIYFSSKLAKKGGAGEGDDEEEEGDE